MIDRKLDRYVAWTGRVSTWSNGDKWWCNVPCFLQRNPILQ